MSINQQHIYSIPLVDILKWIQYYLNLQLIYLTIVFVIQFYHQYTINLLNSKQLPSLRHLLILAAQQLKIQYAVHTGPRRRRNAKALKWIRKTQKWRWKPRKIMVLWECDVILMKHGLVLLGNLQETTGVPTKCSHQTCPIMLQLLNVSHMFFTFAEKKQHGNSTRKHLEK